MQGPPERKLISFLHVNQQEWERELCNSIEQAAQRLHTSVRFGTLDAGIPDLVVYLGSPEGAGDPACAEKLRLALDMDWLVLPIVRDLRRYTDDIPNILKDINGAEWSTAEEFAEDILKLIGLSEPDWRVFLSYLRKETSPLAEQLYDDLHRHRFTVFLDRFEIDHGKHVQGRIHEALHEMTFVLLLESSSAANSMWVEEEIGYALNYQLGLLALALPDIPDPPPFPLIDEDKRYRLNQNDFVRNLHLTDGALNRIRLRIKREHANQLWARRERMVADIQEHLERIGRPAQRRAPYTLVRSGQTRQTIIRVCPRPPDPHDLHRLDAHRLNQQTQMDGWVVADRGGYRERQQVTQWVADELRRPIRWIVPGDLEGEATRNMD